MLKRGKKGFFKSFVVAVLLVAMTAQAVVYAVPTDAAAATQENAETGAPVTQEPTSKRTETPGEAASQETSTPQETSTQQATPTPQETSKQQATPIPQETPKQQVTPTPQETPVQQAAPTSQAADGTGTTDPDTTAPVNTQQGVQPDTPQVTDVPQADKPQETPAPQAAPTPQVTPTPAVEDKATPDPLSVITYVTTNGAKIDIPGTQTITLGISDAAATPESARLIVKKEDTGEKFTADASTIEAGVIAFQLNYQDESQAGSYLLEKISLVMNGVTYEENFADYGMEVRYGVGAAVATSPDEVGIDAQAESGDGNVVSASADADAVSEDKIEQAVQDAVNSAGTLRKQARSGTKVIVIDPGHDATHTGAQGNGMAEETLTLKIAQACKAELEQYPGFKVYMTRNSAACPYPGTSSTDDLYRRVDFAASVHADLYLSIHINSFGSATPKGIEVYYPNKGMNAALSESSQALAQKILDKLVAMGFVSRNIKVWNDEDGKKYTDGSIRDALIVNRECKLRGIPNVLVEHGFITNAGDAAFLKNDGNLARLGVSDASAVAAHFGMVKSASITGIAYQYGKTTFDAGVAMTGNTNNLQLLIQAYDLSTKTWVEVKDWGSAASNWGSFKPHVGDYWLHAELRKPDGTKISEYTMGLHIKTSYQPKPGAITGIDYQYGKTTFDVGAAYTGSVGNLQLVIQAYDLATKTWIMVKDKGPVASNWGSFKPHAGDYWLHAELRKPDGTKVSERTIGLYIKTGYQPKPGAITGIDYQYGKTTFNVGAAYTGSVGNLQLVIQAYDLATKTWIMVKDKGPVASNWGSFKPHAGDYWLHTELRKPDGTKVSERTIGLYIKTGYQPKPGAITGIDYQYGKTTFDVGAAYTGSVSNLQLVIQAYDLATKTWIMVKDKGPVASNWGSFKPLAGDYWLHVELRKPDGTKVSERTIGIHINTSYRFSADITGVLVLDHRLSMDIGVDYTTKAKQAMFRFQYYDTRAKKWGLICDWHKGNWITWSPKSGSYWIYVQSRTEDGIVKDKCIGYVFNRGTVASEFKNLTAAQTIAKLAPLTRQSQQKTGILSSVTMAQFILESGWGTSDLALHANNCFGMKASLSANTWSGSTWDQKSIYTKKTNEEDGKGQLITITANFRKYDCVEDSISDHGAYLLGAKNGTGLRYKGLSGEKNYKKAATIIKNGGYATDSDYVTSLCRIIEQYKLTQYDL